MEKALHRIIQATMLIIMTGILILMMLFSKTDYFFKLSSYLYIFNPVSLVFISGIIYAYVFTKRRHITQHLLVQRINFDRLVIVLTVLLFICQCFVLYSIFFETGWDPDVIRRAALNLASSVPVGIQNTEYFSIYPNNLLITFICAVILRINRFWGRFSNEYTMMSCVIVNCMINSFSCLLVYKTSALYTDKKHAFAGFILAIVLIGISPWSVFFYSDPVGLFIPILVFYLYAKPRKNRTHEIISHAFAALWAVLGYFIKPQCLIILLAIFAYKIIQIFSGSKSKRIANLFVMVLVCVICFSASSFVINRIADIFGFALNPEEKFGIPHFLMMGTNPYTDGTFCYDDCMFSLSFATTQERNAANIGMVFERLNDMGFAGYIKHLCKKILVLFNDGTFAWGKEGNFFHSLYGSSTAASVFLKSIYYDEGSLYRYTSAIIHFFWIATLVLIFIGCLPERKHFVPNQRSIIYLCLIGLILFELLFEVRARYLYTHVPLFCVLASLGMHRLSAFRRKNVLIRHPDK